MPIAIRDSSCRTFCKTAALLMALCTVLVTTACDKKLFYKSAFSTGLDLARTETQAEESGEEETTPNPPVENGMAGKRTIPVEILNQGHDVYVQYCQTCHGEKGDGQGISAAGMRPAPRDFRSGLVKFGGVAAGKLPQDAALDRTLSHGLAGTPMLAWDLGPQERNAVIQYIKTFSPRWKEEKLGRPLIVPADPWKGKEAEAVEVGKRIYHLTGAENDASGNLKYLMAGCSGCHASYITRDERAALSQKYTGAPPAATAELEEMYRPALKASEYTLGDRQLQILPMDFLFHQVKNGTAPQELYATIASGITGAAMPAWKGVLSEESLWALTHYVKSLIDLRGTKQAVALRQLLMAQPPLPPEPIK